MITLALLGCAAPLGPAPGVATADGCVLAVHVARDEEVPETTASELLAALVAAGPTLDLRLVPDAGTARTFDLGDPLAGDAPDALADAVTAIATPVRDGVELVVVPTLAAPHTVAARTLGTLRGVALSPWAPALPAGLDDLPPWTPSVFAAAAELHGRPDAGRVLAHELGHALGLAHDPRPDNLMYGGGDGAALDAVQRHTVRTTACPELPA